ncbi:MAG: restriction endonuclease subunit R [Actinobacteria bacterium 69-20]|jgi:superfamily II DNA or RNA helicase|nr:DEAD/DEAH box helicase family protein [Actinomycetota bacterium]OJV25790.1 MAG: restriction endonuclease subunit R [Actinobacteria bacterium 69-20]
MRDTPPPRLRAWQADAITGYLQDLPKDYLVTATPGAGKTTFALAVARHLLDRRLVQRVAVVCPTDHLRTQWADAAAHSGLTLDPTMTNADGPVRDGADGYVTTYAQVAGRPAIHAARGRTRQTLVVLDEIHHAGDGLSWGNAVADAFDEVSRRLCLTGTPFRTRADERIPFVRYDITEHADGDMLTSLADYTYGYREALADTVVRPVVFAAYTGVSRWRNSAGEVIAASLSEAGTKSVEAAAWQTALDPKGGWVPHVIAAMDERISHLRASGMPDAAGLLLASDQDSARAYAELVRSITGERPALILSDDPKASKKIERFRNAATRMAVCVRMISEGVDIPRAACLAWMTNYRTPLFFAQAVGRVVRARRRGEVATVFLPAVRPLLALAAEMESERNAVVMPPARADEDGLDPLDLPEPAEQGSNLGIETLDSDASFAHVLASGQAVTATAGATGYELTVDDEEFLGLPGLLTAEQTAVLLARRDSELRRRVAAGRADHLAATGTDDAVSVETTGVGWRRAADLRREVNQLVGRLAARTGESHAAIHSRLRRDVPGPVSAAAGVELLEDRRDHLLGML